MLNVSNPGRSVEWYQGLFGMPMTARQGNTAVLRVGDGPQFMAIGRDPFVALGIHHLGLAVDDFDTDRILAAMGRTVGLEVAAGEIAVRNPTRGAEFGGGPEGTPELFFEDPDGIVVQLQASTYCGGGGALGDECMVTPEPAPGEGLLTLLDYNHFTIFVTDQPRSVALYQRLFGMPIDTYQGALPVLRVGSGNQFLALAGGRESPRGAHINHVCLSVENFDVERILGVLGDYGVTPRGDDAGTVGPLTSYVTMRMPNRGGAPGGTPELYFTDPDGILFQLQDSTYCGGNGYLGNECGTPENPTGRLG